MDLDYLQYGLMDDEATNSTGIGPSQSPTHSNHGFDETNFEDEQRAIAKRQELNHFLKMIDFDDPKVDELIAVEFIDELNPKDWPNYEAENKAALIGLKTQLKVIFNFWWSKALIFHSNLCIVINLFRLLKINLKKKIVIKWKKKKFIPKKKRK